LYIQRRFNQFITAFPKGDWVFEQKQITIIANKSYTLNITGLCYGDVNGSNLPAVVPGSPCQLIPAVVFGGRIYNTIQMGSQCWMRENLNIGAPIPAGQMASDNGLIEKYCYNNDTNNCLEFGGLYSWNEMMQYSTSLNRGICPEGWHIPTDADWSVLVNYCGGEDSAGGKLKEPGMAHWHNPNTGATNEKGFTALGAGMRDPYGIFYSIRDYAFFWSSTTNNPNDAWARYPGFDNMAIYRYYNSKGNGFSVRCIHD